MEEIITVLTPVYNRKQEMRNLFSSLCSQSNKNFIWMIIDDGSSDGLEHLIDEFIQQADFKIEYTYKENGGKHTALNIGFKVIETELTFIVDSDDILTEDAIETVIREWNLVRDKNLAGMSFLCSLKNGEIIGTEFPNNGIYNEIDIRFKYKAVGDKAEVLRTEILKKYHFPEFENEKFISENYLWWHIAMEYDMKYVNQVIYIAEYLEGGLSNQGRKLKIKNPLGVMESSKLCFNYRFPLKERIKNALLYISHGKFAGMNFRDITSKSGNVKLIIISYIFGVMLYWYWKRVYDIK